jgi:hypothetical protein
VTWAKNVLTMLVLANWFACIVHCQSEQAVPLTSGGSSRAVCHAASQPKDGGDCPGICDWVVSGGYKASENRVDLPDRLSAHLSALFQAKDSPAPLGPSKHTFVQLSNASPKHLRTFLDFCRTALPPRAPSLLA